MNVIHVIEKRLKNKEHILAFKNEIKKNNIKSSLIVHVHGMPKFLSFYRLLSLLRIRIIFTLYNENVHKINENSKTKTKNPSFQLLKKIYPISSKIVFNDCDFKINNDSKLIDESMVHHNSIGYFKSIDAKKSDLQFKFNKTIAYRAKEESLADIHILIEAMRYLPTNYNLKLFLSKNDKNLLQGAVDLANNLNVIKRIEFIDRNEIDDDYDVLLFNAYPFIEFDVIIPLLIKNLPILIFNHKLKYCCNVEGLYYIESMAPKTIAQSIKMISETFQGTNIDEIISVWSYEICAEEYINNIYK